MRTYVCAAGQQADQVSRWAFLIVQAFDIVMSLVTGALSIINAVNVKKVMKQSKQNPMIYVMISTFSGGVFYPVYFIESMECNLRIFFLLYICTYGIATSMFQYVNVMEKFYNPKSEYCIPFGKRWNPSKTLNYWTKFHSIFSIYFILGAIAQQVLQEFGDTTGSLNIYDKSLTAIHCGHNVLCMILSVYTIIGNYKFTRSIQASNYKMQTIKIQQTRLVMSTTCTTLVVHIVFTIVNILGTYTTVLSASLFKSFKYWIYISYTTVFAFFNIFGIQLGLSFNNLLQTTKRDMKKQSNEQVI